MELSKYKDLLTVTEVATIIGTTTWTIRRHAGKTIPAPIKITPRMYRWRKVEIVNFLNGASRDAVSNNSN